MDIFDLIMAVNVQPKDRQKYPRQYAPPLQSEKMGAKPMLRTKARSIFEKMNPELAN